MGLVIGIDLGTSETKAGLFDREGNLLHLARCGYPILADHEAGCAEQDPETWWKAVCGTVRDVIRDVAPSELDALCVGGQGPSVVMLDGRGCPLHNAILWMDTRTVAQREELSRRMGRPVSPFAHLPMAMWMRRHRDEAYQQARWFLAAWDYVAFRLCSLAASSSLAYFEPFPLEEIEAAQMPAAQFPAPIQAGSTIAGLSQAAAEETGLPVGLPVVAGVHDGIATFIGAGLVEVGRAADVNGTSGGLALCWNGPIEKRGVFSASWIQPPQYIVGGAMATLGKCFDWVCDVVAGPGANRDSLIAEAMGVPAGADRLIFQPYMAAERAPIWDPLARGVYFGLTLKHGREHLVRAVLESVAFALRHVAGELWEAGAQIDEVRVCGGQAVSDAWNQIKANVIGVPVAVPRVREAALMGTAVLAGIGAGWLPGVAEGANQLVHIDRILRPDPNLHRYYSELFGVYRCLYPALGDAFVELAAVVNGRDKARRVP
jgi:xylulokinase